MPAEIKRYRVSGHDGDGDIHAYETDILARAVEMRALLSEDLRNVELLDRQALPGGSQTLPASQWADRRDHHLTQLLSLVAVNQQSAKAWRDQVDPWFAYTKGAEFLVRTGNFHTFDAIRSHDAQRIKRLLPALTRMHWMSVEAKAMLDGSVEGIVVKDHTYPVWAIRDRALAERPATCTAMHEFLLRWYRVGVLTREQHGEISGDVERAYVERMNDRQEADLSKYDALEGFALA